MTLLTALHHALECVLLDAIQHVVDVLVVQDVVDLEEVTADLLADAVHVEILVILDVILLVLVVAIPLAEAADHLVPLDADLHVPEHVPQQRKEQVVLAVKSVVVLDAIQDAQMHAPHVVDARVAVAAELLVLLDVEEIALVLVVADVVQHVLEDAVENVSLLVVHRAEHLLSNFYILKEKNPMFIRVKLDHEDCVSVERSWYEYNAGLDVLRYLMQQDSINEGYLQQYEKSCCR